MNLARFLLLIVLLLTGAGSCSQIYAQNADILGITSKKEIIERHPVYSIYMDRYQPNEEALSYLSAYTDSVTLWVFMGSWCRESTKHIPGLMKTLERAANPKVEIKYIGVGRKKLEPLSFLNEFKIKYIPTVVVLKGRFEIGRIEEQPHQLIETDLVRVLKSGKKN